MERGGGTFKQWVRFNILNSTIILKVFGKPPVLRCGEIIYLLCHTERISVEPHVLVLCGCCLFLGMNVNFVAVTRKPTVFLEALCDKFPYSFEEVSF